MSPLLSHHDPHPTSKPTGFTLIELLVVIGVITLLVGILLPVLSSARRAGKATVCLGNLRQLAQANTSYLLDYDNHYPQPSQDGAIADNAQAGAALWFNALDYYLQQQVKDYARNNSDERNHAVFKQDPVWLELPGEFPTASGTQTLEPELVRTLKMNEFFGHVTSSTNPSDSVGNTVRFFRVNDIPTASETVLYGDGRAHDTPKTTGEVDKNGAALFYFREGNVGLRHDDGANLVFADASARFATAPIRVTGSDYRAWYDRYSGSTFDEDDRKNWPEVIFNFRPGDFDKDRRY